MARGRRAFFGWRRVGPAAPKPGRQRPTSGAHSDQGHLALILSHLLQLYKWGILAGSDLLPLSVKHCRRSGGYSRNGVSLLLPENISETLLSRNRPTQPSTQSSAAYHHPYFTGEKLRLRLLCERPQVTWSQHADQSKPALVLTFPISGGQPLPEVQKGNPLPQCFWSTSSSYTPCFLASGRKRECSDLEKGAATGKSWAVRLEVLGEWSLQTQEHPTHTLGSSKTHVLPSLLIKD